MKTPSIRQFLLVNLLLTISIITTLSAIGNYFLDRRDIERHLDGVLAQKTIILQALIGDDVDKRDLERLQDHLEQIPVNSQRIFNQIHNDKGKRLFKQRFQVQIWSADGKLLLHTPHVPREPLSDGSEGFSEKLIHHLPWRVFTTHSPQTGMKIMVAERYDLRVELAHNIARDDIYTMLLIYPLLGLLIWVVISRGLKSISQIAHQIRQRAPTYLEPVDIERIPREVKPLIDELNKLFLRLQEGFEREKRFSADAAHELRTPLAALKTHAQIALKTKDTDERDKAIRHLIAGVNRTTHLVQQLLTLSRMHPEVAHIENPVRVDLKKIAVEVLTQLAPEALDKHIDLEFMCDAERVMLEGNPTALDVMLRNLVTNAIRYTPDGSKIDVKLVEDEQHIYLHVIDNGPGIPPELRKRVFERFFRVLGTRVTGSGLGLAIVQQIVQLHHAQIDLCDGPGGEGLDVKITFAKW